MIYCAHCGNQNDDNAFRCVSCGEMIHRADGPDAVYRGGSEVPTHLVWSILVTIFCCIPAGIPAIVYSAIAMGKNGSGEYEAARAAAKTAAMWCWISFGVGLLILVPYMFMIFMGAMGMGGMTP